MLRKQTKVGDYKSEIASSCWDTVIYKNLLINKIVRGPGPLGLRDNTKPLKLLILNILLLLLIWHKVTEKKAN